MKCNCYVQDLSDYERFVIRYGAHSLHCPVYRESGDILDRQRDIETRRHHEPIDISNGINRVPKSAQTLSPKNETWLREQLA